ncbi:hypothetical protein B0O99DRAFT_611366 [Bisporella sp. PMI_857]|nr:hypothetical protein B0O99DRAFT_611366 [Bisporella sp. PMI_857]
MRFNSLIVSAILADLSFAAYDISIYKAGACRESSLGTTCRNLPERACCSKTTRKAATQEEQSKREKKSHTPTLLQMNTSGRIIPLDIHLQSGRPRELNMSRLDQRLSRLTFCKGTANQAPY